MAHSPLFAAVQKLVRTLSMEGRWDDMPEGAPGPSRREILKVAGTGLGMASLASVLPGKRSLAAQAAAPRIAIIGGGMAGMAAALKLADAGVACTVYEAGDQIGGRMFSNTTDWLSGQVTEWGGELIDSNDVTLKRLTTRFGLTLTDMIQAAPWGSSSTFYFDQVYLTYRQFARDFVAFMREVRRSVNLTGFPVTWNTANQAAKDLDQMSLYDYLEDNIQGGHNSPLGRLIDLAYVTEYGLDTQELSALNVSWLLADSSEVRQIVASEDSDDERYHIEGGNQQLPQAIGNHLPVGSIQLGWRLTSLVAQANNLDLGFITSTGSRTITVDHVILCLPFSVLRGMNLSTAGFDALKVKAIRELGYGTNSKLSLQFDNRYWTQSNVWGIGNGTSFTDVGYQSTWESSAGQEGVPGIVTNFTGGTRGTQYSPSAPYTSQGHALTYASNFLTQLEKVWPGVSAHFVGRATLSCPWMNPNLLGSYSCYKVGQITSFSGYEGVRQGNVHFAGEHCSLWAQGFMEGAAEEGERAAAEILADLGV